MIERLFRKNSIIQSFPTDVFLEKLLTEDLLLLWWRFSSGNCCESIFDTVLDIDVTLYPSLSSFFSDEEKFSIGNPLGVAWLLSSMLVILRCPEHILKSRRCWESEIGTCLCRAKSFFGLKSWDCSLIVVSNRFVV